MTTQVMTVDEIRKSRQPAERTSVGLCDSDAFALAQRAGQLLASSGLVPKEYQGNLANCVVALNMAVRIGADPLMVMQNLVIVHGRPTWSSQFLIATFNACGRFSAIRYEFKGTEGQDDWACRAYAIEKSNGERIEGSWISIALAKTEGWYGKNGSKWKTMPQQMLMYRAASWLVRAYAPELAMGLHTAEEVVDAEASRDVTPQTDAAHIADAAEQAAKEVKNVKRRTPKAAPAIEQKESVSLPESFSETHEAVPVAVVADPVPVAAHAPTVSSMFDQAMAAIARATTAAEVQQAMRHTNDMTADDLNRIKDAMGKKNRELMGQVSMPIPAPAPEKPSLMVRMQRAQSQDELDMIASEIDMADPEIQPGLNEIYVQESKRLNQLPL